MPLGSVLVLVRQISQLNPVACPLKTCCVVRQSLALGSFILFRLENAQRIYFFHSPSGQKDGKKKHPVAFFEQLREVEPCELESEGAMAVVDTHAACISLPVSDAFNKPLPKKVSCKS